jgi:DNA helicase-2/ATP-dependent DNA helicase PcrA
MEFAHVFVCGLNEGIFPSRLADTPEEMDEERRLAYVAMTRARSRLFLSGSENAANEGLFKYPSRFIFDIGKENLDCAAALDPLLEEAARLHIEYSEQALQNERRRFSPGDRIVHPVFGSGEVVGIERAASCYRVRFDRLATERNIQFGANLAKAGEESPSA